MADADPGQAAPRLRVRDALQGRVVVDERRLVGEVRDDEQDEAEERRARPPMKTVGDDAQGGEEQQVGHAPAAGRSEMAPRIGETRAFRPTETATAIDRKRLPSRAPNSSTRHRPMAFETTAKLKIVFAKSYSDQATGRVPGRTASVRPGRAGRRRGDRCGSAAHGHGAMIRATASVVRWGRCPCLC